MSELPAWTDSSPTSDPALQRESSPAPEKVRPEEYPITEPGGPFQLPRRDIPTEPPKKTVPYTPAPLRFVPRPQQPGKREVIPFSPHKRPAIRRAA